ncbi:MAG: DUF4956 domain-containing protein [Planctomycetota bacterium]|jgi:hypothetical protein
MNFSDIFSENVLRDLDIVPVLINLVLVLILGQVLSWHYQHFAQVLSNKRKFARLFVFISATTMMVITVVKSSLALSLGLVGALSIIRFRTPIKEPEDLAYLFLALATGIGLGADQRLATCLMFLGILAAITMFQTFRREKGDAPRVYAHVNTPLKGPDGTGVSSEEGLKRLIAQAGEGGTRVDLRRVDCQDGVLSATLILDLKDTSEVGALVTRIQEAFPGATVSVVEGMGLMD